MKISEKQLLKIIIILQSIFHRDLYEDEKDYIKCIIEEIVLQQSEELREIE